MSLKFKDEIYRESLFQSFKGLDTTSSLTNMEPGYLRIADNANIDETGAIKKRKGYEDKLQTHWSYLGTFLSIRFGIEYFVTSSTSQIVLFGEDGVEGFLGVATASVAVVFGGLGALSDNRPSIVQFQKLLFYFNGDYCMLYNGATTRQIGITPPTNAPTGGADIAGGLVVGANYLYAYTYYNSVTGAESSPSPLSAPLVTAVGGKVVNLTAGTATTADTIRIYRTLANQSILFLEGTAAIAAVTFNSVLPDSGLGPLELELDNTRITVWGEPQYAVVSQNRIFVAGLLFPPIGTIALPNRVRFSKIGQSGPMPESYQAQAFVDCESSGGEKDINIGLGQANEVPIVLKKNSIGRLDQVGSIGSDIAEDNVIFEYKEISRAVTTISHWAQCNVYGNIVWIGKDNIFMSDGNQVYPIADRISETLKTFLYNSPVKMSGHNDIKNKRIYFSVTTNVATNECNYIIVGSYRKFPEFNWTIYAPGPNPITHPGFNSGCFFDITQSDGTQEVHFGSSPNVGTYYKMNTNDNDNGNGIYFRVRDYPSSFGLDEEPKLFFKDIVHVQGNGGDYNLQVFSVYDLLDFGTDPALLNLYTPGARWDSALWDSSLWADEDIAVARPYSKHRKAFYEQLEFKNINPNEPITIFGYIKNARPEEFK